MFDAGDLVYDSRLNKVGMIMKVEGKSVLSAVTQEEIDDSWYHVLLFGDEWCKNGKTRGYAVCHGNRILESYNPKIHPVPF